MMRVFPLLLPSTILACIQYSAIYPFNQDLPFEAYISSNDTVVCWISRTYSEHNRLQQLANLAPETKEQRANPDQLTWGFKRWDFTCSEGHQGWANVGVRSVGYIGTHGNLVQWVADMEEDVENEIWEYWKEIGCVGERAEALRRGIEERSQAAIRRIAEEEERKKAENGEEENRKMEGNMENGENKKVEEVQSEL